MLADTHTHVHTHLSPYSLPTRMKSALDRRERERSKLQESVDAVTESIREMGEEQAAVLQDKRRKEKAHKSKLVRRGRGEVLMLIDGDSLHKAEPVRT